VAVAVLVTARAPDRLSAQAVLNQFSYDSLRPSGLQVDLGALGASRLRGTIVGGVRLDYGYVAPHVRVLLGLSYFKGTFNQHAINELNRKLRSIVNDPDSNFTIDVGRITWSDLTGDLDLQYTLPQGRTVTTYLGVGIGVHLRNGSGKAINGTFVEDALDGVSAGLNGTIGADFAVGPQWRLTLEGRGVVATDLSTVSLRAGVMYRFRAGR
jgi:opacity protein-like surface antigen